jgi:hypothetical protein
VLDALVAGQWFVSRPAFLSYFSQTAARGTTGRLEENLWLRMPQMAAEEPRFLYNQNSRRNAMTRMAPVSL